MRKLQVLSTQYDTERYDREATPSSILGDSKSDKRHVVSTCSELSQPSIRGISRQSSVDSTLQEYDQVFCENHVIL